MPFIDLNCDVGEDPRLCDSDAQLLRLVTSANIACGGHAGDDTSMERTIRACLEHGVAVGAHPSYPDRANFGRAPMHMDPAELEAEIARQVCRLGMLARTLGAPLSHVKPHGALYHAASRDRVCALAIAKGSHAWSDPLVLIGAHGARCLQWWREAGFRVAAEGFADRAYEPDGTLRDRALPGSLLTEPALAAAQAVRLAPHVDTICVHSDTPEAAGIARAARDALRRAGYVPRALTGAGPNAPNP